MHDRLLEHQGALQASDLKRYAEELGLDAKRFHRSLRTHAGLTGSPSTWSRPI